VGVNTVNFATTVFWAFFGTVGVVYWSLRCVPRSWRLRKIVLLVASYAFYMGWNWKLSGLILFSTVLDYGVGLVLARATDRRTRRLALAVSVCGNLGVLALFKYAGFFVQSAADLAAIAGLALTPAELHIVLPVGISFYTFQTLSYTIDLYHGRIERCRSALDFALFVAFFPQLVAGPIVRASQFLPQLQIERSLRSVTFGKGAGRILKGLVKKVVIADQIAFVADTVFASPDSFGVLDTWIGVGAFAVQIYCDFSGYSDIAIGVAMLLGFELPSNFDHPYIAGGVTEFWRRWHISLSTWLRDYLYVPLGGSRHGTLATYRNLAITMLLGGLWHGAAWTFVAWGAFQGFFLCLERLCPDLDAEGRGPVFRVGRVLSTLGVTCFGWVLFRAESFSAAMRIWENMIGLGSNHSARGLEYRLLIVALPIIVTHALAASKIPTTRLNVLPVRVCGVTMGVLTVLAYWDQAAEFIYFQF
jgi:alginate O-acetyltransferase complex protein AlgI